MAVAGCGGVSHASGHDSPLNPKTLLRRLFDASIPASQLPHGFRFTKIVRLPVRSVAGRVYHELGVVDVQLAGPDTYDDIYYGVFPTRADARGFSSAKLDNGIKQSPVRPAPIPGFTSLSPQLWAGMTNYHGTDYRVSTGRVLPLGTVGVGASTFTPLPDGRADERGTLELLAAGLRHLASVEGASSLK
jgi:hypothetical protein